VIASGVAGAMAAIGGKVLDLTAVEALATGSSRYAEALLTVATQVGIPLAVAAPTLQAAWSRAPLAARPWLELLSDAAPVVIVDLTAAGARSAGLLAAAAGAIEPHPALVHTVAVALERSWPVVTRDPDAALTVSAAVRTETIP
jgi:hypothetical protein